MINMILSYFIKNDQKFLSKRFQIILEFKKKIKNVLLF
jgi:hypothetical protein